MTSPSVRIRDLLAFIYDDETAGKVLRRLDDRYPGTNGPPSARRRFDHADAVLISYADTVQRGSEAPLRTLARVIDDDAPEYTHLHLLPFFPSSGDGGFSVTDFTAVDPAYGRWDDVASLAAERRLMVDLVLNHASSRSGWFQDFLAGEPGMADWFHVVSPDADLATVFRPRTNPLLTAYQTVRGTEHVWTTFSADQVDLNFAHPPVLEAMLDILAGYVVQGARVLRLDAVGFVWKELGTRCLHHPKTHAIVQLMRAFLDRIAPEVQLVTETNVPHEENISYFGDGRDEAQMVYNFSLPPLVVDAFASGSSEHLSEWAATLSSPGETTFLNFLASHDGIGMTPAYPIIGADRVLELAKRVQRIGGDWSGRATSDGSLVPYELNVAFIDALAEPGDDDATLARRMLAATSIQFALQGVPGVYVHSHLGSRSWRDGPLVTGERRAINRERLDWERLRTEMATPDGLRALVSDGHRRLLRARRDNPAFDPYAPHVVVPVHPGVFSVVRHSDHGGLWCVTNVTGDTVTVNPPSGWGERREVVTDATESGRVVLGPWDYRWYSA